MIFFFQVETSSGKNSEIMSGPRKVSLSLEDGNPEGLELLRKSLKCVRDETTDTSSDAASHIFGTQWLH